MKKNSIFLILFALACGCAEQVHESSAGLSRSEPPAEAEPGSANEIWPSLEPTLGDGPPYCDAVETSMFEHYDDYGLGTLSDPFEIYNAEQLFDLANSSAAWDQHFVQCGDIDLDGFYETHEDFHIATEDLPFSGSYNGRDHAIAHFQGGGGNGLFIRLTGKVERLRLEWPRIQGIATWSGPLANIATDGAKVYRVDVLGGVMFRPEWFGFCRWGGLIGLLRNSSIVRSSTVWGTTIEIESDSESIAAGGLIGEMNSGSSLLHSSVEMVKIRATRPAGAISHIQAGGGPGVNHVRDVHVRDTRLEGQASGGFVMNFVKGLIEESSVLNTEIRSRGFLVGGFAGHTREQSQIHDCFTNASIEIPFTDVVTVAGGFVGSSKGLITESQSHGAVNVAVGSTARAGGFVGHLDGGAIEDSFATGDTTVFTTGESQTLVGGFGGALWAQWDAPAEVSNSYSSGDVQVNAGSSSVAAGRFAGRASHVHVSNSFATGDLNDGPAELGCFVGDAWGSATLENNWIQIPNEPCELEDSTSVAPLAVFSFPNENFGFDWSEDIWLFQSGILPSHL